MSDVWSQISSHIVIVVILTTIVFLVDFKVLEFFIEMFVILIMIRTLHQFATEHVPGLQFFLLSIKRRKQALVLVPR
jgi:hypothetical protein